MRIACLLLGAMLGSVSPVAEAQTFATLHNFSAGTDGSGPQGLVAASNNRLFGSARSGGTGGSGTLFEINADGSRFVTVYNFDPGLGNFPYTNADGITPNDPAVSGEIIYGTTGQGGAWGYGSVYSVHTDGTGFTNLHSFSPAPGFGSANEDGANPYGRLIVSSNKLYGTTSGGGHAGSGTVFRLNTDGSGFTNLYHLPGFGGAGFPLAGLVLSGTRLYGTTSVGGDPSAGTVFAVNIDGTDFATLHTFAVSEGAYPQTALLLSGDTLFGTTLNGGASGIGSVFKIQTDGSGFLPLHSLSGAGTPLTNVDGGFPNAKLALAGDVLYGATSQGGPGGWGTLFSLSTNGGNFRVVHSFTGRSDGLYPNGDLVLLGDMLYGTASGGSSGAGVLFSVSPAPQLTILGAGPGTILIAWPTNNAGFSLQSTANFLSSSIWTPVFPAPVIVNGQNTVNASISAAHKYFRLVR